MISYRAYIPTPLNIIFLILSYRGAKLWDVTSCTTFTNNKKTISLTASRFSYVIIM